MPQHRRSSFLVACLAALAAALPGAAEGALLDREAVGRTIAGIAAELREGYDFPEKGMAAADALETALAENAYAGEADPDRFAARLTGQLRAITRDSHVRVIHGSPFGDRPAPAGPEDAGFELRRLDGDVGYIRLKRFVPPDVFDPAADDAMRALSDTAALIVDMRDNGGGHPASVAYLVSFFLDPGRRVHINDLIWRNRATATFRTESFWSTPTPVHYQKPVFVLVGPATYSAGEEFAYDLQALKRATVVGARTRGGANPGGLTELGAGLFVVVPTGRAENPITGGNWEGEGVRPDVEAAPEDARNAALALALQRRKS